MACLSLILENSQALLFQIFFHHSFFLLLVFQLHICYDIVPQFGDLVCFVLFLFFSFFLSSFILVWDVFMTCLQIDPFLCHVKSTDELIEGILLLFYCVFYSPHFLLFLHRVLPLIYSSILVCYSLFH